MAITGRNAAIVQTGRFRLTGRLAWITWGFLHLTYLPGTVNRMTTGLKYLWWHLSHENTNRVLIEPEPASPLPRPARGRRRLCSHTPRQDRQTSPCRQKRHDLDVTEHCFPTDGGQST